MIVYTDGGAQNTGNGKSINASAAVYIPEPNLKFAFNIGDLTSVQAEYEAIIAAMHIALAYGLLDIHIHSDNQLCVKQIWSAHLHRSGYSCQCGHLKVLLEIIGNLIPRFEHFDISHIKREFNREADALVRAVKRDKKPITPKPSTWHDVTLNGELLLFNAEGG